MTTKQKKKKKKKKKVFKYKNRYTENYALLTINFFKSIIEKNLI